MSSQTEKVNTKIANGLSYENKNKIFKWIEIM